MGLVVGAQPRRYAVVVDQPPARHLLRAKDLADRRYADALSVADMARAAHLSPAHFSREFRRVFGESPHRYLLTRRLERAAAWLTSLGSFTTSFGRMFGKTPTAYRASVPPAAAWAMVPACVLRANGRPRHRTFREDG
jgi:AraC-like DNA-binding protein